MRVQGGACFLGVGLAFAVAAACGGGGGEEVAPPSTPPSTLPTRAEHGLETRPANPTCLAPPRPSSNQPVAFERVYETVNLEAPMMLAQPPGNGAFWYVALRDGRLVRFDAAAPATSPVQVASLATLSGTQVQQQSEGGFLGFAFHPRFSENGRVYVSWVSTGGDSNFRSVVGVITSQDGGASFTTYETILTFDQPAGNHNGGGIAFGKDGHLYLSFGDGGGGDDPFNHGQETTTFFSKVLRIDVDTPTAGQKYGIPADNPFASGGGEPATYARGFRNPFRISIDRETGELWAGDVGQNQWEEVDRVEKGQNYGWPCVEGTHPYLTQKCASLAGLRAPVVEHQHVPNNSRSITGGVVYRGKAIPAFAGRYVYGDYKTTELFALFEDASTGALTSTLLNEQGPNANWVAFAEDQDGEVYAVALNQGSVYKLVAQGATPSAAVPARLSETGCVDPTDPKKPAPGLVPYGVNAPLWSDGAEKQRYLAIPDGTRITVDGQGDFGLPIGSVLVKTFDVGQRRIETRLFVRHEDGDWGGYTYEWNDAQTDAALVVGSKTREVSGLVWTFPSRAECMRCHTEAAGRSLGLEIGQLNGDQVYPSTNRVANQLATLEHIGMFDAPLGKPASELTVYPRPSEDGPVEGRARAYLHANCSGCHRPGGGGRGALDLRFATPFAATASCNAAPEAGDLGVTGAKLLVPGVPEQSLVVVRPKTTGGGRMPPIGSRVVDERGTALLDAWVRGLTGCP